MCVVKPEPVFSQINVFDSKNRSLVNNIQTESQLIFYRKNFTIFEVTQMNPTKTKDDPIVDYSDVDEKLCAECLNGKFDDPVATPPSPPNPNSHIFPPAPFPHYNALEVFLGGKFYKKYDNVELEDGEIFFCIYQGNQMWAMYTKCGKKGFTHVP